MTKFRILITNLRIKRYVIYLLTVFPLAILIFYQYPLSIANSSVEFLPIYSRENILEIVQELKNYKKTNTNDENLQYFTSKQLLEKQNLEHENLSKFNQGNYNCQKSCRAVISKHRNLFQNSSIPIQSRKRIQEKINFSETAWRKNNNKFGYNRGKNELFAFDNQSNRFLLNNQTYVRNLLNLAELEVEKYWSWLNNYHQQKDAPSKLKLNQLDTDYQNLKFETPIPEIYHLTWFNCREFTPVHFVCLYSILKFSSSNGKIYFHTNCVPKLKLEDGSSSLTLFGKLVNLAGDKLVINHVLLPKQIWKFLHYARIENQNRDLKFVRTDLNWTEQIFKHQPRKSLSKKYNMPEIRRRDMKVEYPRSSPEKSQKITDDFYVFEDKSISQPTTLELIEHVSDYFRLLVLIKYGGIYLDDDVLCLKNLQENPEKFNFLNSYLPMTTLQIYDTAK